MAALTRDAVKTAQAMLSAEFPGLQDDGVWGASTERAYRGASPALRAYVDQTLRDEFGVGKIQTRLSERSRPVESTRPGHAKQQSNWSKAKVLTGVSGIRDLIQQIAAKEGVPFDTAYRIAWLESKLNPNAVSPTGAIGVYQLTSIARADIAKRGGYVVRDPKDPVQNITGGLKYIKLVAHDLGAPLSDGPRIYMGFNIGATGAEHVMAGQPEKAASQIALQAYGPPAVYAANLTKAVNSVNV